VGNQLDNIVVVDDDPRLRELVATLLTHAGYRVREAGTAHEALELVDEEQPAAVLLDVVLPGVSGYELCRQLRDRYGASLPIIFVSGTRTDSLDSVAGLLLGADDYMAKPFDPGELVARVRLCVERANRSSNGAASENGAPGRKHGLTARELEVLELLADGVGTRAIAARLVISEKTVATHIQRIMTKLGVHTRAAAVAKALRERLVAMDVQAHIASDVLDDVATDVA
jgi:DNA-binding NarL/FixJ family response regulator